MQSKNKLYLALMIGSIFVLFVVQFFWLRSVYRDYQSSFRQETNLLFANTVTGMLDSLVLKGMSPMFIPGMPDTIWTNRLNGNLNMRDSLRSLRIEVFSSNSDVKIAGDTLKDFTRQIQVISSGKTMELDSIKGVFRPIIQNFDSIEGPNKMIFRFNQKGLEAKDVENTFNQALKESGIPIAAKVRKINMTEKPDSISKDYLVLDEIRIPFGTRIQGYFDSYQRYLFGKMLPPTIFAFLVIAFIGLSMYLMYRNMIKQQQLNLLKNEIISNITHELKTPVATISVVLESLQHFGANDNPETKNEYIQIAKNELKRLTSMTENILRSTVLGANQDQVMQNLDLSNLLVENLNSLKPVLDSKGFEFHLEEKGTDYNILGNAEQLSLVIFNLLDNAIKYSRDRQFIKVSLNSMADQVVLQVEDHGIGIPESFQKDIFEKFIRVPQENLHDVKGYGLGLAQVAEIVKAHKGKIQLSSQLGKGSTFTVILPKA